MTQKFSAPTTGRKQPDFFCFTFGMRTARSATLLVNGTMWSLQYGVGVQAKAPQQIVGDRLFDACERSGRLAGFGSELFAFSDDGVVKCPEGGDIGGTEPDFVLAWLFMF
jgi:hypothetical protein